MDSTSWGRLKGTIYESWLGCRKSITRREQPSRVTFRGNCKTWQKSGESFGTASSFAHNFPTPWLGEEWRRKNTARSQVRLYIRWKISSHHLRCRCWVKPGGKGVRGESGGSFGRYRNIASSIWCSHALCLDESERCPIEKIAWNIFMLPTLHPCLEECPM